MNFKSLGIGAAIVGTVAAVTFTGAPAQAASIGLGGSVTINEAAGSPPPASTLLNFNPIILPGTAQGFFTQYTSVAIADLPLVFDGVNYVLNLDAPLPWKTYTNGETGATATFSLNPGAAWSRILDANGDGDLSYEQVGEYTGTYTFSDGSPSLPGTGFLNVTRSGFEGTPSFQITQQAIPTPALLPGLIGMGLAASRKRKTKQMA